MSILRTFRRRPCPPPLALVLCLIPLFLRCGVRPDEALSSGGRPAHLQEIGIQKILLTDTKEGVRHLYVIDEKSSGARRLTTVPMRRSGVWSPDGRQIAYREMNDSGGNVSLNVMKEDGTEVRQLVGYPSGPIIYGLKWSPDGSRIAFRVGPPSMALRVIRSDGTGLTTIEALETPTEIANMLGGFAWSPDSRTLAYEAKYAGDAVVQVHLVNADGTGRRRLSNASRAAETPAWSPDGKQVVFESGSQVYALNADGTGQRQVVSGSAFDPIWSPKGDAIVYRPSFGGLGAVNADGSEGRQITGPNAGTSVPVSWSLDGSRIAFLWVSGGRTSVYVVALTGNELQRLVDDVGSFDVKWSR